MTSARTRRATTRPRPVDASSGITARQALEDEDGRMHDVDLVIVNAEPCP